MQKINWQIKRIGIGELKDWSKNPRKLSKEGYQSLKKSVEDFGFHDVLKIDTDGTIISGHQRKRVLKEMGIEYIDVLYPNRKLTDKEMEIIAIKSNRHEGEFDFDILGNMFELETLMEAGFQDFELGFATSKEQDGVDSDPLVGSMTTYLTGNVKQITLFFSLEEFEKIVPRLDKIMKESNMESHTEVFLRTLEIYENNNTTKKRTK